MKISSFAASALAGVLLLSDGPALTPWSEAVSEAQIPASEQFRTTLSTSNPTKGCATRSRDCTFKPCCDDRTCRQNGDGEKLCR